MARKQKKASNRRARAKLKVAKLHYRVSNQRKAILHDVSDYLTSHFNLITIENLNVKGMVKNRKLARAISDAGFGTLRAFIEYKAKLRDCNIVIADRFYPSSKTCPCCGKIKENLTLADRIYKCGCGFKLDRDLNAAINLNNYG
jgi:putative transposase